MSDKHAICDQELLRRSLDDALSDVQEEELARHLSECADCQQELERLAAQQTDWSKVGSVLKREAASSPLTEHFPAQPANEHDEIAADFAVDFLEPSPAPDALGRLAEIDVLEVIGRGGMGVVLKGFEPELKRLRGHQSPGSASGRTARWPEAVRPRGAGGRGRRASAA